jgi:hypothetical protein
MSASSPHPAPGPGADHPLDHWVELRIHGVSGTPPEAMLESAHVVQVAGNAWGRFFRPADAVGREVQDEPGRTLEGYHWGKYTSGSALKGLWLLLIPFGLVNAAAFMLPDPGPDRLNRQLHAVALGLIRAVGVGLTCTFALTSGLILVDLVGYSWATGVPWLAALGVHWTLAAGLVLSGGVIFVLHRLGDQNRFADFDPAPQGSLAAETAPAGMRRRTFFTETVAAPVLGRLHLATGYSVVALTGALTWQTIADTRAATGADTPGGGLQTVVWAVSLLLLLVSFNLVVWLGDPEQAISGTTDYAWHTILPMLSRWLVIVSGGAVLVSAGLLASTRPPQLVLDLDSYARFLPLGSTLAILPLLVVCAWLGRRTVRSPSTTTPAPFRGYAGGLAAWAATSTGLFVGVGFCAAFDLGIAKLVGRPAQTDLIYRIAYAWGLTVCLVVLLVLVALPWWRRQARANLPGVGLAYQRVGTDTGLSTELPRGWDRKVAAAVSTAQGKLHVAAPVLVFAVVGTVISVITWMEMFHWDTPGLVAWLSHGRQGPPSALDAAAAHESAAFVVLYNVGTYALIASAAMLFWAGRRALRTEQTRRGMNVVWDVISFWPHSVHPFVPPSYAQFAVHDLRRRIRFHLDLPAAPGATTAGRADVPDDAPRVVVSAHSQGSLIAFATMLWLGEEERRRVALVTYGSQLQVAFPRGFPAYVDFRLLRLVRARLRNRWVNLYRETDPIAGPVLSWDRSAVPPAPGDPTSSRLGAVGSHADLVDVTTGRRESGSDWRVLDPPPADPTLQTTSVTHLSKHSGYPATTDYRAAVQALLARL